MSIDEIREQLAYKISTDMNWDRKTNDTNPGNYGYVDVEVALSEENIFIDIPNRTFTLKMLYIHSVLGLVVQEVKIAKCFLLVLMLKYKGNLYLKIKKQ
jgi:hypothetical protein